MSYILTIPSRSRQAIKGRVLRMTHRSTRNQDLDKPAQQYQLGPGRRRTTSGTGCPRQPSKRSATMSGGGSSSCFDRFGQGVLGVGLRVWSWWCGLWCHFPLWMAILRTIGSGCGVRGVCRRGGRGRGVRVSRALVGARRCVERVKPVGGLGRGSSWLGWRGFPGRSVVVQLGSGAEQVQVGVGV